MTAFSKTTAAFGALLASSAMAHAADPYGTWTRPSTGAQLSFYPCDAKLCAKVVGVKDQSKKHMIGKVIIAGAAKSGNAAWEGDLLNLEDGKTYSGTVTLVSATALNLKGCALGGLICKDETLTK